MEYTFIPFFHVRTTRDDATLPMDGANPTKVDANEEEF